MKPTYIIPANVKYSPTHMWAKVETPSPKNRSEGWVRVRVGITDFLRQELQEIINVEMWVGYGNVVSSSSTYPIAALEATKSNIIEEIYTPISGVIREMNNELEEESKNINQDVYGLGWLIEIEAKRDEFASENLLDAAEYTQLVTKYALQRNEKLLVLCPLCKDLVAHFLLTENYVSKMKEGLHTVCTFCNKIINITQKGKTIKIELSQKDAAEIEELYELPLDGFNTD